MNENEEKTAEKLLAVVGQHIGNPEISAIAVSNYKNFLEACYYRQAARQFRIDKPETPASAPEEAVETVEWWVAELNMYGSPKPFDGPYSTRGEVEKIMPLVKSLTERKGELVVAKVEFFR